jgi:hypothetical protein
MSSNKRKSSAEAGAAGAAKAKKTKKDEGSDDDKMSEDDRVEVTEMKEEDKVKKNRELLKKAWVINSDLHKASRELTYASNHFTNECDRAADFIPELCEALKGRESEIAQLIAAIKVSQE